MQTILSNIIVYCSRSSAYAADAVAYAVKGIQWWDYASYRYLVLLNAMRELWRVIVTNKQLFYTFLIKRLMVAGRVCICYESIGIRWALSVSELERIREALKRDSMDHDCPLNLLFTFSTFQKAHADWF